MVLGLSNSLDAQNLSNGLIAHYTFSNGSMVDLTINGNDALNQGTTPFYNIDLVENEAIKFDSANYVSLPEDILLRDQLSVSLWFKTSKSGLILATQNEEALDVNGVSTSYYPNIYIDAQNILRAGFWTGNGAQMLASANNYADNRWHHLVLIADNSRQYLYVDNQRLTDAFYNRTVLPTLKYAQLGVGKVANYPNNGGEGWMDFDGGKIDNVRIYGNAITPFFVRDIYNLEKADAQSIAFGLVAHYTFDNGSVSDKSQNDNDAVNNGTVPSQDIDSASDMAVSFGTNNYLNLPNGILLKTNISISLWFKTSSTGAILGYQAGSALSASSTHVPVIYIDENKVLRTAFWSGAIRNVNTSTVDYADNLWHHLVLTSDASRQELYLDNQLINQSNFGHTLLTNMVNAQLGLAKVNGWPLSNREIWMDFDGASLDNVRIYHNKLNATKVDQIYQLEKAQPISGILSLDKIQDLIVYPNPASGVINTEEGQIQIMDSFGREVLNQESNGRIDVSEFTSGTYLILQNGKRTKLIIE